MSQGLKNSHVSTKIIDDMLHSDHVPVSVSFSIDIDLFQREEAKFNPRIAWYKAKPAHIQQYQTKVHDRLSVLLDENEELLACSDVTCEEHKHQLMHLYTQTLTALIESADKVIPKTKEPRSSGSTTVPGWSEYVKDARQEAMAWHRLWVQHGRPHHGDIAERRSPVPSRYQEL